MQFVRFVSLPDGSKVGLNGYYRGQYGMPKVMSMSQLRHGPGDYYMVQGLIGVREGDCYTNGSWDKAKLTERQNRLRAMKPADLRDYLDGFTETSALVFANGKAFQIPLCPATVHVLKKDNRGEFASRYDIKLVELIQDGKVCAKTKSISSMRGIISHDLAVVTDNFGNRSLNLEVLENFADPMGNGMPPITVRITLFNKTTIEVHPFDLLVTSKYSRKTIKKLLG